MRSSASGDLKNTQNHRFGAISNILAPVVPNLATYIREIVGDFLRSLGDSREIEWDKSEKLGQIS